MSQYYRVPDDTFETIQMDAGIVCSGFTPATGAYESIIGAIDSSGFNFNSNPTFNDFGEDVGNVPPNTWQLKRITSYDPTATGTMVNITDALLKTLNGAGTVETVETSGGAKKITPTHELLESDFKNIWLIGNYSKGNTGTGSSGTYCGYVAIHLVKALNTTGVQWQTAKDGKGTFPFEFHGHYDLTDPDTVPYEIYIRKGATE